MGFFTERELRLSNIVINANTTPNPLHDYILGYANGVERNIFERQLDDIYQLMT